MKRIASLLTALVLSACAHVGHAALPAGAHYVNMGSSFASGAGTGPAAEGSPARCYQSTANYAHLLAARLNLALTDVSCGGATSAHLLSPWNELPAQIEAIDRETRLVTITIGGNDLALAGNLTAASCDAGESIRVAGMVLPCPSRFPVADAAYATLERNLSEAAHAIAQRAPHARVVFIQYVTLVPQTQCPQTRLTEEEAAELRAVATRLAEITARAAAANGAEVLRMDDLSRAQTPCDSDPWSLGFPADYAEAMGAPWHPNRRGMAVIAEKLEDFLAR